MKSQSPAQQPFNWVSVYVAAVLVLGIASVWAAAVFELTLPADRELSVSGVLMFVGIGLGLELAHHKLAVGSAAGSIAFVAFIGAALVFGPLWGALVTVVSIGCAQTLNRRRPTRIAFNVAQYTFAIVAGSTVYVLMGARLPVETFDTRGLTAFAGFSFTFFVLNSGLVSGVIALNERRPFLEVWMRNTWGLAAYDLVASTLALGIAWLYGRFGAWSVVGVVVPILFIRHIYSVNLALQATNHELLELMVKAIEARDPYTSGHSQRVAQLGEALARDLRLGLREIESISTAALLHDVGKIYEEFAPILRKEGRLTAEEKRVMESHPLRSAELVGTISSLHGYVYKCVRNHHENFDGSGYPDGLSGEQIPVGARIIMIADTVDAMTTDRPYRKALSYERVVEELAKFSGKQFDPRMVSVFRRAPAVRRVIEGRINLQTESPGVELPVRGQERALQSAVR